MGYNLGGRTAESHAWVESEIQPGTWREIEPQDDTSLNKMYTRFYYPLTRATFLEDKNSNWAEAIALIAAQNLTFKQLP